MKNKFKTLVENLLKENINSLPSNVEEKIIELTNDFQDSTWENKKASENYRIASNILFRYMKDNWDKMFDSWSSASYDLGGVVINRISKTRLAEIEIELNYYTRKEDSISVYKTFLKKFLSKFKNKSEIKFTVRNTGTYR